MRRRVFVPAIAATVIATGLAQAQPAAGERVERGGDGYCDYVLGVAHAESARLFSPDVFGTFGFVEQSPSSVNPSQPSNGTLRFIGGLRFSLSNVYEGIATRDRAKADCRRHEAVDQIRSETLHQALEARLKVYEDALPEAAKVLAQVNADMSERRTTAQEATATRLRVEELRRLATDTRTALRNLPARGGKLDGALTAFQQADDDVERSDAKLRRARALDVLVEQVTRRSEETATLEEDLEKQIAVLTRVGGDDSRRYRQIVWFDLVKIRADRAYHDAHLAALKQARGAGAGGSGGGGAP